MESMRVELVDALETAGHIRITYNAKILFTRDYAAGETPVLDFETPKESGIATATLVIGETQTPLGMAAYIFDDLLGAKMLKEEALELSRAEKNWAARTKLQRAIALLEKFEPDGDDMADAYLQMCWVYYSAKSRTKSLKRERQLEALAWYEKALAVWERNGNKSFLRGNLTNASGIYSRLGFHKKGVALAERALKMQLEVPLEREGISAWTHAAGRNVEAGNLDRADRICKDGIKRYGENEPYTAYLWNLRSQIATMRAKAFREKAEAILPPDACPI